MQRATEKYLGQQVEELRGLGCAFDLRFGNGYVKLVEKTNEKGAARDLSQPMRQGQMAIWLDAYRRGFMAALRLSPANDQLKRLVVLWHDGHDTIDGKPTFDICGRNTCMSVAKVLREVGAL